MGARLGASSGGWSGNERKFDPLERHGCERKRMVGAILCVLFWSQSRRLKCFEAQRIGEVNLLGYTPAPKR